MLIPLDDKVLYDSIPEAHRHPLDTRDADVAVSFEFIVGQPQKAIGSIIMPIIFVNAETIALLREYVSNYSLAVVVSIWSAFVSLATSTYRRLSLESHTYVWIFRI